MDYRYEFLLGIDLSVCEDLTRLCRFWYYREYESELVSSEKPENLLIADSCSCLDYHT